MSEQASIEAYEKHYGELQAVVARLEAGDLPLAELLRLYEAGVRLAATCQRLLDQAELRVEHLQRTDQIIND